MAAITGIEWCDFAFAPWFGCTRVSPACDLCYAEHWTVNRFHKAEWGPHGARVRAAASTWRAPLTWQRKAVADGERRRVFCSHLSDVFDNDAPDEWRSDLWELIAQCPNLDWLILTKRPQNIEKMLPAGWPWPQVWLGVTAENMEEWNRRVPILRRVSATVRFVSVEPMLERMLVDLDSIRWIICGGETDPARQHRVRGMAPAWARDLRDLCALWSVPFFMKQMSGHAAIPRDLMVREFPVI